MVVVPWHGQSLVPVLQLLPDGFLPDGSPDPRLRPCSGCGCHPPPGLVLRAVTPLAHLALHVQHLKNEGQLLRVAVDNLRTTEAFSSLSPGRFSPVFDREGRPSCVDASQPAGRPVPPVASLRAS